MDQHTKHKPSHRWIFGHEVRGGEYPVIQITCDETDPKDDARKYSYGGYYGPELSFHQAIHFRREDSDTHEAGEITEEALLAILLDRVQSLRGSTHDEAFYAERNLTLALEWLRDRRRRLIAQQEKGS